MSNTNFTASMLSRVGIIGDVHAEHLSLAAVLDYMRHEDVTTILCTGDIAEGDGDISRCCALLETFDVYTVSGNHDRWFLYQAQETVVDDQNVPVSLEASTFLATLPKTIRFVTPYGFLLLCHGLGEDDLAGFYPDDDTYAMESNHALHALVSGGEYRYVVNGHTHRPMVRSVQGVTFINAGTLRPGPGSGFLIADFRHASVTFYKLDEGGAIREAETVRLPK